MPVRLANGRFAKKGTPEYIAGMRAQSFLDVEKIQRAMQQASFESLGQAAGRLRLEARKLIKTRGKGEKPNAEGQPVKTKFGRIKEAIVFYNDKAGYAIIGPSYDIIGPAASPHELGGNFRGQQFAARPFMQPALDKLKPRLDKFWADSITP